MNRRWRFIKIWALLALLLSANVSLLRPALAWQTANLGHRSSLLETPHESARSLEIYAVCLADSGIRSDIDTQGQAIGERVRYLTTACLPTFSGSFHLPVVAWQPVGCLPSDQAATLLAHKTRWQI